LAEITQQDILLDEQLHKLDAELEAEVGKHSEAVEMANLELEVLVESEKEADEHNAAEGDQKAEEEQKLKLLQEQISSRKDMLIQAQEEQATTEVQGKISSRSLSSWMANCRCSLRSSQTWSNTATFSLLLLRR